MIDRRSALKKIGLSIGYMAVTPTVFNILQSCTNETKLLWRPKFFSEEESILITNLIDIILPKTEKTLGAIDVNVPQFIDSYYNEVVEISEQNSFKNGIHLILNTLGADAKKIELKNYNSLLTKYLKANHKERKAFENNKNENLVYNTLTKLRSKAVWAFKTSKEIGKTVLIYDPVPGVQIGCMPLQEATGGKGWSLMN